MEAIERDPEEEGEDLNETIHVTIQLYSRNLTQISVHDVARIQKEGGSESKKGVRRGGVSTQNEVCKSHKLIGSF